MIGRILLAGLVVVPLSCSSSNVQTEVAPSPDSSVSPAPSADRHRVRYSAQCEPEARREGLTVVRDCSFEVSYYTAEGRRWERREGSWGYTFISAPGDSATMTVERRGNLSGRLNLYMEVDAQRSRVILHDGQKGPVTVELDIP